MVKAIVFNGFICAGKTTLANHLNTEYGWDKISFGDYVKYIADKTQSPKSRKSLQDIGYNLFTKYPCNVFLKKVIDFENPNSDVHIHDSIRHPDMLSELNNYYSHVVVFYLNISDCDRYKRYVKKYNDGKTFTQFKEYDKHPVEKDIPKLMVYSKYKLDETKQVRKLVSKIKLILKKERFLEI